MKEKLFLLLILYAPFLQGCQQNKAGAKHSINVTVVCDITDYHTLLPVASPIIKLYGFDTLQDQEASFRICPISDKQLNPAVEYHLPEGSVTEKENGDDDPYYREKTVLTFYEVIKKDIGDFVKGAKLDSSLEHSECFSTIATELRLMKSKHGDRNVLLVFSDIQENSDLFTSYSRLNQTILTNDPDKIVDLFNATHLLPDNLKNTKVIFVYQPQSREADKRFAAMEDVYRRLLESRGASVQAQANNNYFN